MNFQRRKCLTFLIIFCTFFTLFYTFYINQLNYEVSGYLIEYPNDQDLLNLTTLTNSSTLNPQYKEFIKLKLKPDSLCNQDKNIVFAYIMTRVDSFEKRESIRRTWANSSLFSNLKVAFVIGLSNDLNLNEKLIKEHKQFDDLIQGNFLDTYRNLTYKSLIAWKWITNYCTNAKYIIKIDDDLALNSKNLIEFFQINNETVNKKSNSFFCHVCLKGEPHRNPKSKWHASYEEYNGKLYGKDYQNLYPTFCYGPAYIMTPDLISQLYFYSNYVKFFWLEDIYTALLARHIRNVKFHQIQSKYIYKSSAKSNKNYFFIRDVHTNEDLNQIMNYIQK
jgi:hypothetical protein